MKIFEFVNDRYCLTVNRDPNGELLISVGRIGQRHGIFLDVQQEEYLLDALLNAKMDQLKAQAAG